MHAGISAFSGHLHYLLQQPATSATPSRKKVKHQWQSTLLLGYANVLLCRSTAPNAPQCTKHMYDRHTSLTTHPLPHPQPHCHTTLSHHTVTLTTLSYSYSPHCHIHTTLSHSHYTVTFTPHCPFTLHSHIHATLSYSHHTVTLTTLSYSHHTLCNMQLFVLNELMYGNCHP